MKIPALALAVLAAVTVPTAHADEPKPAPTATGTGSAGLAGIPPGVVDGQAAHRLVAAGVKVVDVRTASEFSEGHVPGAVNIPFDEMGRRSSEIGPPSTAVLLYCHSGRRSGIAGQTLREKGFTQLYDMKSYDAWVTSEPAPAAR